MRLSRAIFAFALVLLPIGPGSLSAQEILSHDELKEADYMAGKKRIPGSLQRLPHIGRQQHGPHGSSIMGRF